MILKLRDSKIQVCDMDYATNTHITYEYELNTNHLLPKLVIKYDSGYITSTDKHPVISLDDIPDRSRVQINVQLLDNNRHSIRSYNTEFIIYKYIAIHDVGDVDIYKENMRLKEKINKLLEEGEVI